MLERHFVCVTYRLPSGNTTTIQTSINGSRAEITAYFRIGSPFNIGDGPNDRIATVESLEFVI